MGETPDELRHQVEQARSRLDQDLNQLDYRVKEVTDWRFQFDRHPWIFLGAAFGGALLLSLLLFGSRRT
jgi:hypothetical protein